MTITRGPLSVVLPAPQDLVGFSDAQAIEGIAATQQVIGAAQALQVRLIARLSTIRNDDRAVSAEIALELGVSRHTAQRRVALSDALLTRLPGTLAQLESGTADLYKCEKIDEATAPLSDNKCRELDTRLAPRLAGKDPTQIRRAARDLVHRIDGEGANARARKRRRDRKVVLSHEDDAMATLLVYLPAEIAAAVYARLDTIARKLKREGDDRTLDQLRADVLAELLLGTSSGHGTVLSSIFLHVPIGTALGITEHGAFLEGHGQIPGEIARQIMQDKNSVWRKIITDPASGAVLDVGRKRRRPPAALRDFGKARDRECRMPTCHRPAQHSEIDHSQPWRDNGTTNDRNLDSLCKHDNLLKEKPGWNFRHDPATGDLAITTPTGRTYHAPPEPLITPEPPPATVVENDDDGPAPPTVVENDDEPPPF
jgi:Domain of unknown function (DUF222)/HNH endonuclease